VITLLVIFAIAMLIAFAFGPTWALSDIARDRKYKSGTIWCFWRWTYVDSEYILRLHVVKTPWFAVCLHWIRKPDAEPWLHDHPVSFLSIVLRGGYTELRKIGDGKTFHKVNRWFNFVRSSDTDRHRIILTRTNTLTLCFMGPKTREWGFHVWEEMCPEGTATPGWIMWKRYYERLRAGEDMRRIATMADFDHALQKIYTAERVGQLAGAPNGSLLDFPMREIDTDPADDFTAEPPTEPRNDAQTRTDLEDIALGQGDFRPETVALYRAWAAKDGVDVSTDEELQRYVRSGRWMGTTRV
jgi:hypothetical protein